MIHPQHEIVNFFYFVRIGCLYLGTQIIGYMASPHPQFRRSHFLQRDLIKVLMRQRSLSASGMHLPVGTLEGPTQITGLSSRHSLVHLCQRI